MVTLSPYVSETNIIFSIKSHRGIFNHILYGVQGKSRQGGWLRI